MSAAKILIDDYDNYASSVHCSYYGCFQYIKHKLNQLGHTYEQIDLAIQQSKDNKGVVLSTHGYPLQLIQKELTAKYKDSGFLAREIKDKVKLLKAFRTLSDYHNEIVDYDKGKKALTLSNEVLNIIKTKL